MPITALPTPAPSTSDPSTFDARADALVAALPTAITEANALETNVNAKEVSAAASAASALSRKTDAEAAAALAALTVGAAKWVSGTTYAIGNVVWSPTNYLSYRRKTNGAGTTDPSSDTTNWSALLPFSGSTKALAGTDTASAMTPADVAAAQAVLAREPNQGVVLQAGAAAAILNAHSAVFSNTTNSFGIGGDFILPSWTPAANQILRNKWAANVGYKLEVVLTSGAFVLYLNAKTYTSAVPGGGAASNLVAGTRHKVLAVPTVGASTTTVSFYLDGVLLSTTAAQANEDVTNTQDMYTGGTSAVRYAMTVFDVYDFNYAHTAAEVLDLYRNGIAFADKWGSQTEQTSGTLTIGKKYRINNWITDDDFTNVGGANVDGTEFTATATTPTHWAHSSTVVEIGATLALESEGIQPAPGEWLDSSSNNLHALQPASGSSLIRKTFTTGVPVGAEMFWPSETPPSGWLEENGASLLRASYPQLFAIIGTMYGTADATHFNLPDMRGKFPRIWDHAAAVDPDRATRTAPTTPGATLTAGDHVGTEQADEFKSHNHGPAYTNSGGGSTAAGGATYSFQTVSAGGNETRPVNAYRMMIMKAF